MSLMKCRKCQNEFSIGFMPDTTCGLLLIPAMMAAAGACGVLWRFLGWYTLLLFVPLLVVCGLAVDYIPRSLEYVLYCRRKCPECGAASWTFPYTKGFGL